MELSALKKQLQEHLGDGLVLIVGSELSCVEGVPGMDALGHHLVTHIPASLSLEDTKLWEEIHPLIETNGLEAALLKHAPTPSLEAAIVQSTGNFIAATEASPRKAVCDILEGGQGAFQERARRLRVRLER